MYGVNLLCVALFCLLSYECLNDSWYNVRQDRQVMSVWSDVVCV